MPMLDDDGEWTDPQCQPRALDPRLVGDECTILGTFGSGLDDCEIAAMCWDVADGSTTGVCVSFRLAAVAGLRRPGNDLLVHR